MKRTVRLFKETVEMRSGWIARLRRHRVFPFALLGAAFLLASCIHVWQRFMVFELVDEVSDLRRENVMLVDEARKIQSDIASLSLASRIEQYAIDSLGLERIDPNRLFTLETRDPAGIPPSKLQSLRSALGRIASHMPVVSETRASTYQRRQINLDSVNALGGGE